MSEAANLVEKPADRSDILRIVPDEPIWNRLPNETANCYAHFIRFRNLGPQERRLCKVSGITHQYAKELSAKHNWRKRAAAWDDYLILLQDNLSLPAKIKARVEHLRLGQKLVAKAEQFTEALTTKKATAFDAATLAQAGVEISREALEMAQGKAQGASQNMNIGLSFVTPAWAKATENKALSAELTGDVVDTMTLIGHVEKANTAGVLVLPGEQVLERDRGRIPISTSDHEK